MRLDRLDNLHTSLSLDKPNQLGQGWFLLLKCQGSTMALDVSSVSWEGSLIPLCVLFLFSKWISSGQVARWNSRHTQKVSRVIWKWPLFIIIIFKHCKRQTKNKNRRMRNRIKYISQDSRVLDAAVCPFVFKLFILFSLFTVPFSCLNQSTASIWTSAVLSQATYEQWKCLSMAALPEHSTLSVVPCCVKNSGRKTSPCQQRGKRQPFLLHGMAHRRLPGITVALQEQTSLPGCKAQERHAINTSEPDFSLLAGVSLWLGHRW